jgi:hypothetical protein
METVSFIVNNLREIKFVVAELTMLSTDRSPVSPASSSFTGILWSYSDQVWRSYDRPRCAGQALFHTVGI